MLSDPDMKLPSMKNWSRYGDKYSPLRWMEAKRAQAKLTNDSMEEYAARKLAKQKYKSMSQPIRGWKQEQER